MFLPFIGRCERLSKEVDGKLAVNIAATNTYRKADQHVKKYDNNDDDDDENGANQILG